MGTSAVIDRLNALVEPSFAPTTTVPTGLDALDVALDGGLRRGQVVAVTSRPGVGCSTFATGLARYAAYQAGLSSVMVAPRTSADEIAARILSAEARVPITQIRSGVLDESSRQRLRDSKARLKTDLLAISAGWGPPSSAADPVEHGRWNDRDLIVLDDINYYFDGSTSILLPRLRDHARRTSSAVVVVAPLSASASTDAPDLREIGALGTVWEDADLVISIHRDDVSCQDSSRPGEAELTIAKHRYGAQRTISVLFQGHYARFVPYAAQPGGKP
ncbi:DnaB-like helicase C-terminal domain-containing protein [Nocardioides marmorisolisilvae]|uniref:SF4 helicase domain-containing protein n=1 Tax=Nocardioides marmorisolisilvae TaxID=1542737 RepID=A0A3N0DVW9_9ACTN|nr:DnaB-like helicase C-terminal domain-containing protein [Nocardioides marmorisolisilvae]RNL79711.1 hypothetical protein EFL95_12170 [Nocardioides marmorisolisilvae]